MVDKLLSLRSRMMSVLEKLKPVAPLLLRLAVGVVFLRTGWGKLHNLDGVTEFFTSLHIPAPRFQATLVAWTELLGGASLLLGLATRLAAIPLSVTMVVAILTAVMPDLDDKLDLLGKNELLYLVIFLGLAVAGPGAFSLDQLIARRLEAKKPAAPPASALPA